MLTREWILSLDKEDLADSAYKLQKEDIEYLLGFLSEKDDKVRHAAFLLLQERSHKEADVYPYWDTFRGKLKVKILIREV